MNQLKPATQSIVVCNSETGEPESVIVPDYEYQIAQFCDVGEGHTAVLIPMVDYLSMTWEEMKEAVYRAARDAAEAVDSVVSAVAEVFDK